MADEVVGKAPRYLPGGTYSTIAHDEHSAPGFLFSHGSGPYLYTTDGRRFLDVMLGHGSLLLGHSHPAVVEAVKRQVELGNTFTHVTGPAIRLAEMIVEDVPCAEMVRFVNSGTEAVMLALRIARAHTGKDAILKFEGAYHGFADGLLFSTNYGRADRWPGHPQPDPDTPGIPSGHAQDILIAPWNDIEATREIVSDNRDHLAGIIVEPVMRGLASRPGFLEQVRELASATGVPLIFDEVGTGFRLALGGAQEYYGVTPDLTTFGKGLGSGYPIGAVGGSDEFMRYLDPASPDDERVFSLGSFHGNAVSAAAAVATIERLREPGAYEHLGGYGNRLRDGLEDLFRRFDLAVRMTGEANIVEWLFSTEPITDYRSSLATNRALKDRIGAEMRHHGIFGGGGRLNSSTEHGDTELALTLEAMEGTLTALQDSGTLHN